MNSEWVVITCLGDANLANHIDEMAHQGFTPWDVVFTGKVKAMNSDTNKEVIVEKYLLIMKKSSNIFTGPGEIQ